MTDKSTPTPEGQALAEAVDAYERLYFAMGCACSYDECGCLELECEACGARSEMDKALAEFRARRSK